MKEIATELILADNISLNNNNIQDNIISNLIKSKWNKNERYTVYN